MMGVYSNGVLGRITDKIKIDQQIIELATVQQPIPLTP